jgi:hypothetical protein
MDPDIWQAEVLPTRLAFRYVVNSRRAKTISSGSLEDQLDDNNPS